MSGAGGAEGSGRSASAEPEGCSEGWLPSRPAEPGPADSGRSCAAEPPPVSRPERGREAGEKLAAPAPPSRGLRAGGDGAAADPVRHRALPSRSWSRAVLVALGPARDEDDGRTSGPSSSRSCCCCCRKDAAAAATGGARRRPPQSWPVAASKSSASGPAGSSGMLSMYSSPPASTPPAAPLDAEVGLALRGRGGLADSTRAAPDTGRELGGDGVGDTFSHSLRDRPTYQGMAGN